MVQESHRPLYVVEQLEGEPQVFTEKMYRIVTKKLKDMLTNQR